MLFFRRFEEVSGLHISDVKRHSEGEHVHGGADRTAVHRACKADMVADSESFLTRELHITGQHIYRFFAVTVGQLVVELIIRYGVPYAALVLDVTGAYLVAVDFAKVVEKRDYRDGLIRAAQVEILFRLLPRHVIA